MSSAFVVLALVGPMLSGPALVQEKSKAFQSSAKDPDILGSLRGIRRIRVMIDGRPDEATSLPSEAEMARRVEAILSKERVGVSVDEPGERRRPDALFRLQFQDLIVDDKTAVSFAFKLVLPTVSPNDPNGPTTFALLWEHRHGWIGPHRLATQRFNEIVDKWVAKFCDDYRKANAERSRAEGSR